MRTSYRSSNPAAYPHQQEWKRRAIATRRKSKTSTPMYLLAGLAIVAVVFPFFLIAAILLAFNGLNLMLPGVRSGEVKIGGMTPDRAAKALDKAWNYDRKLQVTDGARAWTASPLDFGLWVNPGLTVTHAMEIGRGPDAGSELGLMLAGQTGEVSPVVEFRPELARLQLDRWSALVESAPRDAAIVYRDGRWMATSAAAGMHLDVDATLAQMQANPNLVLASGILKLVVQPVQPHVSDLSQELNRIQALTSEPLTIRAYDPINDETVRWETTPEDRAGWMHVGEQGGSPMLEVDAQKFNDYLIGQQARIGAGRVFEPLPLNANLASALTNGRNLAVYILRLPTEYVVQPGDTLVSIGFDLGIPYWHIQDANPGLTASNLSAGAAITIPSRNVMLPLPVVENKRVMISISQQRLWEYENGQLRREEIISTGIDRSPTYAGVFQIQSHDLEAYASVWDLYMPHFLGIYEAMPGFMNGLHGLPTLSSGARMWADALGREASYGCIILGLEAAEDLYNWAEDGVVVEIQS